MITLIALIQETQFGEENIYDSVLRASKFRETAAEYGVTVKGLYWTMGSYDGVLVLECPDAKTGSALLLRLGSGGAVRTTTLQAFDEGEMRQILERSQG